MAAYRRPFHSGGAPSDPLATGRSVAPYIGASAIERSTVNRAQECPFLLRLFHRKGQHHAPHEFDKDNFHNLEDELQVYTWSDVSLSELRDLIKDVLPEAQQPGLILSFKLVYPANTGHSAMVSIGRVESGRKRPQVLFFYMFMLVC